MGAIATAVTAAESAVIAVATIRPLKRLPPQRAAVSVDSYTLLNSTKITRLGDEAGFFCSFLQKDLTDGCDFGLGDADVEGIIGLLAHKAARLYHICNGR